MRKVSSPLNTPAHALLAVASLAGGRRRPFTRYALLGAVLPDLPMFGFYLWQRGVVGLPESQIWREAYFRANWQLVFDRVRRVNSAALDPHSTGTIYLNTFQNAAFRSDDWGDSWQRITGYRFKWGQRPIPDVNNPGMLYLTTYGGSVHYGPARGVPDEMPDITNMPQSWW